MKIRGGFIAALWLLAPPLVACTAAQNIELAVASSSIDASKIRIAFHGLDAASSAARALVKAGVLKRGSPRAIAIANGLGDVRDALNEASALSRAEQVVKAAAAWQDADVALCRVQALIDSKEALCPTATH